MRSSDEHRHSRRSPRGSRSIATFAIRRRDRGDALVGWRRIGPLHEVPAGDTALLHHLLALPWYREYVLEDIKDAQRTGTPRLRQARLHGLQAPAGALRPRAGFTVLVSMKLVQDSASQSSADPSPGVIRLPITRSILTGPSVADAVGTDSAVESEPAKWPDRVALY